MSETEIRNYAQRKSFHPQTLERWLSWAEADRNALAEIAFALKMSENHLRDAMDWLEEIALRDQSTIHKVLRGKAITEIQTDPRLGRADRVKRIKDQLRRMRFPRLAETEDAIQKKVQSLELKPEIRVSVPPGLEGGRIYVEISAASREELRRASKKLSDATENELTAEIFTLLSGGRAESEKR
jgi:hypothetical protein